MALVNAYATVAELRTHLADGSSALSLDLLERALNASSRAVDRHCGRRFWKDAVATVRTYRIESCEYVFVDDISTRTGLIVKTGSDGVTFGTTLTSSEYILEPSNADVLASGDTADPHAFWQITSLSSSFAVERRFPTMQVTAKFGWSAVPYEVNEATILKAASLFKRKDAPFAVAGFGPDMGVVRIGRNDPDVIDLLNPFVQPGFA